MKTLVVAPHPDDETLGCGGTVALATRSGQSAGVVFLTSGELGLDERPAKEAMAIREAEAEKAATILGLSSSSFLRHPDWQLSDVRTEVTCDLVRVIEKETPDRILVPDPGEWHPDHAVTGEIVEAALQMIGAGPAVLTYEVWTPMRSFEHVHDISEVMDIKLAAIAVYTSQLAKFRYADAVEGLDRFRGALAGHCRYAEVLGTLAGRSQWRI
jgi:LmbE family N-acetylglucosaminyl deacetylase